MSGPTLSFHRYEKDEIMFRYFVFIIFNQLITSGWYGTQELDEEKKTSLYVCVYVICFIENSE